MDGKTTQTFDGPFPDVTAQRRVPDLDWLTEHNNRVWGCSSTENVIYACKLGDATNWFSYRGTAADSYAVTVGSDGAFTGAATCMGYVLFFKENGLHKLYGTKPSDYQMSSIQCSGVAKGAHQSLCVINETLYYLSMDGVMAWDGSLPTKVSASLDETAMSRVTRAAAGGLVGGTTCTPRAPAGRGCWCTTPRKDSGTRRTPPAGPCAAPGGSSTSGTKRQSGPQTGAGKPAAKRTRWNMRL